MRSVVKSIYCFSREPGFSSQHPVKAYNVNSSFRVYGTFSDTLGYLAFIYTYMQAKQLSHKIKTFFKKNLNISPLNMVKKKILFYPGQAVHKHNKLPKISLLSNQNNQYRIPVSLQRSDRLAQNPRYSSCTFGLVVSSWKGLWRARERGQLALHSFSSLVTHPVLGQTKKSAKFLPRSALQVNTLSSTALHTA